MHRDTRLTATGARSTIEHTIGYPTVALRLQGRPVLGAFGLNGHEHQRRAQLGIGAITSVALLCALWMLPRGGITPPELLPVGKVRRLRAAPHSVQETDGGFERLYDPPGVLGAVVFAGRSAERAVYQAARFTPIVERYVLLEQFNGPLAASVQSVAREWGVGVLSVSPRYGTQVLIPAADAVTGVPSAYRWWIAELAYESYLYDSAHAAS